MFTSALNMLASVCFQNLRASDRILSPQMTMPIAILYYDYVLTFDREVRLIWMRKFSYISVMYFLCRYALLSNLLFLIAMTGYLPSVSPITFCIYPLLKQLYTNAVCFQFLISAREHAKRQYYRAVMAITPSFARFLVA